MSKRVKGSLVAAAILGILICMVIMQWEGFSDDDDSADDDDSSRFDQLLPAPGGLSGHRRGACRSPESAGRCSTGG
jgi:hypothetical protein